MLPKKYLKEVIDLGDGRENFYRKTGKLAKQAHGSVL